MNLRIIKDKLICYRIDPSFARKCTYWSELMCNFDPN